MPTLDNALPRLRATVTDARLENLRWRQNQIQALHASLRTNVESVCAAISHDVSASVEAAEREFFLTMDAVRQIYETLDFEQSVKDYTLVKRGKNDLDRRVPFGLVAIRPVLHSRLYSAVGPLVAALAAGNCVVLELSSSCKVDSVLADILPKAMDRDCFFLTTSPIPASQYSQIDLLVDQTSAAHQSSTNTLSSSADARTIAVVDRSADIKLAAEAIATARLAPHHTSPYSPDVVIVYELWVEQFIEAVFEHAARVCSPTREKSAVQGQQGKIDELVKAETKKGTVASRYDARSGLTLLHVQDRSSPLLLTKITGPYLVLLTALSVMDATILQSSSTATSSPTSNLSQTYLASYLFATPAIGGALGQFIPASISYVNQIPIPLLYGPAAPSSLSPSSSSLTLHPRYTTPLFSLPRPQIISPTTSEPLTSSLTDLKEKSTTPLKPTGQRPGHAVGFFEQGIFLGLGITAMVILPALGWGVWVTARGAVRWVSR